MAEAAALAARLDAQQGKLEELVSHVALLAGKLEEQAAVVRSVNEKLDKQSAIARSIAWPQPLGHHSSTTHMPHGCLSAHHNGLIMLALLFWPPYWDPKVQTEPLSTT